MQQLAINNQFGFSVPRKISSGQSRKKNDFESVIPSQLKVQEYRDSDYYLDSISDLTRNQSLTAEQIAKSKKQSIVDEINALSLKYIISNFEEVKSFLSKNLFLFSLLEEIPNKVFQYFGKNQKIALKISHEPEFSNSSELWIYIPTTLSAKEALPILESFDEEWWLENIDKSDGKLNITLKFV